jgi:hypothetical protein
MTEQAGVLSAATGSMAKILKPAARARIKPKRRERCIDDYSQRSPIGPFVLFYTI